MLCRLRRFLLHAGIFGFLLPMTGTAQVLHCGGADGREHHCPVNTEQGVTLVRETGRVRCTRGYSWDYGGGEIWVANGCAGDFSLASRPPSNWEEEEVPQGSYLISCAGEGDEPVYCVRVSRVSAELVRQRGESRCKEGKNWGLDPEGLWVTKGCAADFLVKQKMLVDSNSLETVNLIECASVDGKRNFCQADARGGAVLRAILSHVPCKLGESWEWNEGGVWVDHGCHALFEVTGAPETDLGAPVRRCYLSLGEPLASEWEAECYALHVGKFAPCNAKNSCAELSEAIRRGCAARGKSAPEFCEKYTDEGE